MPNLAQATNFDEARGPTKGIADPSARKEIEKLWSVLEGRLPVTGKTPQNHTLVTRSELLTVEASLTRQISALTPANQLQTTLVGGGVGSSTAGVSGNLLGSDNAWSGRNDWLKLASATVKPSRFQSLEAGVLALSQPTILLQSAYATAVDVQRTSDAALASAAGGSVGLYVQHRAQGASVAGALTCGIRAAMESAQSDGSIVGGYFSVANYGQNTSGHGLHVDAYHGASGVNANTYGVDVLMAGTQIGATVGYLVRSSGTIGGAFVAGSPSLGTLNCQVAFDASFAVCATAAMSMRSGSRILFDASPTAFAMSSSGSELQVTYGGSRVVAFGQDGSVHAVGGLVCLSHAQVGGSVAFLGSLHMVSPAIRSPLTRLAPNHSADVRIILAGAEAWIPYFS